MYSNLTSGNGLSTEPAKGPAADANRLKSSGFMGHAKRSDFEQRAEGRKARIYTLRKSGSLLEHVRLQLSEDGENLCFLATNLYVVRASQNNEAMRETLEERYRKEFQYTLVSTSSIEELGKAWPEPNLPSESLEVVAIVNDWKVDGEAGKGVKLQLCVPRPELSPTTRYIGLVERSGEVRSLLLWEIKD